MKRSALFVFVAASALACKDSGKLTPTLPPVDSKDVLLEDNFESENNGQGVFNWRNFKNWNVIRGCVDLHGNGFVDVEPGNGLYVDLDGSEDVDPLACPTAGLMESKQEFTLQQGKYVLEYYLAGSHRAPRPDTLTVSLGSVFQKQHVLNSTAPFQLFSNSITVSQSTTAHIRFDHAGHDQEGILLDLVRLRRVQ